MSTGEITYIHGDDDLYAEALVGEHADPVEAATAHWRDNLGCLLNPGEHEDIRLHAYIEVDGAVEQPPGYGTDDGCAFDWQPGEPWNRRHPAKDCTVRIECTARVLP